MVSVELRYPSSKRNCYDGGVCWLSSSVRGLWQTSHPPMYIHVLGYAAAEMYQATAESENLLQENASVKANCPIQMQSFK